MNNDNHNKFHWGESVKVKGTAPINFHPGKIASVCEMIKIKSKPTETVHYTYDALNQLIEASTENQTIHFTYDPLRRRLIKQIQDGIRECYLWDRREEIGGANTLKVMGAKAPIAIEIKGRAYAPIQDIQGNIRHLVNAYTKKSTISHTYSAFGEEINPQVGFHQNPWRYAGKRWDQELSLSYFGKRYYDPRLGRWLTTDPAGAVDATNPYWRQLKVGEFDKEAP